MEKVTIAPYRVNSLKEIENPFLSATSATTIFAAAPLRVPFPPKQTPKANAHQSGVIFSAKWLPTSLIISIKVATVGILPKTALTIPEPQRIVKMVK